jgi:hypothetical protein
VTTLGALPTLRAGAVFGLWPGLFGLVLGVSILAFGVVQSALVSNQHVIYAFQPDARSRLNTIFMTGMFLGAAGSAGPEWPSTAHLSRRKEELRRAGT